MPEEMMIVTVMFMMCATGIITFAISRIFPPGRRDRDREVQELRNTVHRLESRMEALEAVVSGTQFQAAQRVTRAVGETARERSLTPADPETVPPTQLNR